MKLLLRLFGVLLILIGSVWILQGINVLPGSFMSGQIEFAFLGGISVAAGIGLFVYARRRGATPKSE